MRLSRESVLDGAFAILDRYGLGDLTMRRLAAELGVQAGGLYWHFANKQTLLAAMADRIASGPAVTGVASDDPKRWQQQLTALCTGFRDALLAHRDGAELVAAGYALHPGSGEPLESMIKILDRSGLATAPSRAAAAALTHFVLGHAAEVQAHDQLRQAGALPEEQDVPQDTDLDEAFIIGLEIFIDGLAARLRHDTKRVVPDHGRAGG
ncbi:TetR/AcrR family transcriptional regulator C-terminal domain-containing protein [Microlunatus soli]|uniref:DNA-binding transcriptional regulator, AcrR family n=1 Tax=Microlunatus soli TaxID=630515 RepID=A0A1H1Z379_9ACTN|nr:TetR/AcrR family transcriptional regulator C-terminal domain-containing protein [Microlunatus soli]SDT28108.1 DNA-binding transcriptional regulator, AcrR family [Microlunatus soli]